MSFPVQECKDAYLDMINIVIKHFTSHMDEKFIKGNDKLLIKLTIDDLAEREEGDVIDENEAKEAKANRGLWIDTLEKLKTNESKAAFAALTVYRNSGVPVLHLNNIEHIAADVAYPYLVKVNNNRENNVMMLNHILLISKLLKHYSRIFALGLAAFINRETATAILTNKNNTYVNVFRLSFSRLGELVHTEKTIGFLKHSLIDKKRYLVDEIQSTRYTFKTADCDDVVLKLLNPEQVLAVICKCGNVFSPYYNTFDIKNIEKDSRTYADLSRINDQQYQDL
jgi:hypothetical protein